MLYRRVYGQEMALSSGGSALLFVVGIVGMWGRQLFLEGWTNLFITIG
jgi:hypothetical protein